MLVFICSLTQCRYTLLLEGRTRGPYGSAAVGGVTAARLEAGPVHFSPPSREGPSWFQAGRNLKTQLIKSKNEQPVCQ